MAAKFDAGLSDHYLGGTDQGVMEAAFEDGKMQQQRTQSGSSMDGERVSRGQGAGLNQPVGTGTSPRRHPAGR